MPSYDRSLLAQIADTRNALVRRLNERLSKRRTAYINLLEPELRRLILEAFEAGDLVLKYGEIGPRYMPYDLEFDEEDDGYRNADQEVYVEARPRDPRPPHRKLRARKQKVGVLVRSYSRRDGRSTLGSLSFDPAENGPGGDPIGSPDEDGEWIVFNDAREITAEFKAEILKRVLAAFVPGPELTGPGAANPWHRRTSG